MTEEKGKLLEINHEETFQAPSLVVIKEGGALTCFPKRIQLLFKGLTAKANILNDREKEIFLFLQNGISLNQEYFSYLKIYKSFISLKL